MIDAADRLKLLKRQIINVCGFYKILMDFLEFAKLRF